MVDRTEIIVTKAQKYRYILFEVVMSSNDTVTIADLTTITDVALINLADGLEDTATISGNIITLTEAGVTNTHFVGIVVGG